MRLNFAALSDWWFAHAVPPFPDNEQITIVEREHRRKIRLMSLSSLLGIAVSIPLLLKYIQSPGMGTVAVSLFEVIAIFALYINKRGHFTAATYIFFTGIIAVTAFGMLTIGTANDLLFLWLWLPLALPTIAVSFFLPFWSPFIFATLASSIVTLGLLVLKHNPTIEGFFPVSDRLNFLVYVYVLLFGLASIGAVYTFSVNRAIIQVDRATELEQVHAALAERARELEQTHAELAEAYAKLERLATIDPITGIFNHRAFNDYFALAFTRAKEEQHDLSFIFADLDHFKHVNDTWGHQAGDLILAHLASLFAQELGERGVVARYGGEEFVILLPAYDLSTAERIAERLRMLVNSTPAVLPGGEHIVLTVSMGVAAFPLHGTTIDAIIEAADNAMYQAKRSGRNRVCIAGNPSVYTMPKETSGVN